MLHAITAPVLAACAVALVALSPMSVQAHGDHKNGHHRTSAPGIASEPRGQVDLPPCDAPSTLRKVDAQLAHAHKNLGTPELIKGSITHIVSSPAYGFDITPGRIAHRHCRASASFSDGRIRTLVYLIEGRMGFASLSSGVVACVSGFDRWRVHGGLCDSLTHRNYR